MKSSGASIVATAAGFICGIVTMHAMRQPSDAWLLRWAWGLGRWIVEKLEIPSTFQLAPAIAIAVFAGLLAYGLAFLLFWRLEIWAAGKASEISQQALRRRGGDSVQEEMKKLTRKHGR